MRERGKQPGKRMVWAMLAGPLLLAFCGLADGAANLTAGAPHVGSGPARAAAAPTAMRPAAWPAKLMAPPPMGWSSWNSFSNTVSSEVVQQQAKALVTSGMERAGYRYVNIDEGWWLGARDRDGNIVVDAKQWPALTPGERSGDMSNIVKYIHRLGLKAGIYTDAGESGCGYYGPDLGPPEPHTGSEGHYEQDFLQFAKWGFDYVKVDWCGGDHENLDPAVQYAEIARAIEMAEVDTGHQLFFSICNWGRQSPWTWAPGIGGVSGDIWRVSGDIVAPIVAHTRSGSRRAGFTKVISNFDRGIHPEAQHTGFYNDPDMMVIGMPGLSDAQNRVHMSLWAMSGAPLIAGADLTTLSKTTLETLTNREVIAVDQDPLGLQCVKVAEPSTGLQVWAKRLAGSGRRAVLLLNRTTSAASIPVQWSELGFSPSSSATVRDLWAHKDLGPYASLYTAHVAAGDAVMLLIKGAEGKPTRYEASSAANVFDGGAAPLLCASCSGGESVAIGGHKTMTFKNVTSPDKLAAIQIAYMNPGSVPRVAELRVNGQRAIRIAFPPTGDKNAVGMITIESALNPSGAKNALTFSSPCGSGLAFDSISVLAGQV